jgi:hypothetical protein
MQALSRSRLPIRAHLRKPQMGKKVIGVSFREKLRAASTSASLPHSEKWSLTTLLTLSLKVCSSCILLYCPDIEELAPSSTLSSTVTLSLEHQSLKSQKESSMLGTSSLSRSMCRLPDKQNSQTFLLSWPKLVVSSLAKSLSTVRSR